MGPLGVEKDSGVKFLGPVKIVSWRRSALWCLEKRVGWNFFFRRRLVFGLVFGDMKGSGLGISLFRCMQVPGKVPSGLMQVDGVVCFRDWGLFWALSGVG